MRPLTRACGGSSRKIASDETDLPDPDSPTSPSTSPGAMRETHVAHRAHIALRSGEIDGEILDFQQPGHSVIVTGARGLRLPSLRLCRHTNLHLWYLQLLAY